MKYDFNNYELEMTDYKIRSNFFYQNSYLYKIDNNIFSQIGSKDQNIVLLEFNI